jgi:hypothetical protein
LLAAEQPVEELSSLSFWRNWRACVVGLSSNMLDILASAALQSHQLRSKILRRELFNRLLSVLASVAAIELFAGCTRTETPAAQVTPLGTAAVSGTAAAAQMATASAKPTASSARVVPTAPATATPNHLSKLPGAEPKSWTDPRVIAALAKDCKFAPQIANTREMGESPNLFACSFGYQQSCAPDACGGRIEQCHTECGNSCGSCGEACSTSCAACKAPCTDDACRAACATSCANCKQECVRTMDNCASGKCVSVGKVCNDHIREACKRPECKAEAKQAGACTRPCASVRLSSEQAHTCYHDCGMKNDPANQTCQDKCDAEIGPDAPSTAKYSCYFACPINPCAQGQCGM